MQLVKHQKGAVRHQHKNQVVLLPEGFCFT